MTADHMGERPGTPSYHFAKDRSRIYFDGQPRKGGRSRDPSPSSMSLGWVIWNMA